MIKHALFFTLFICSFLPSMDHEHYYPLTSQCTPQSLIQRYQNFIVQPANIINIKEITISCETISCGSVTYFAVLNSGEKIVCTHVSHGQFANQAITCIFNLQANPPFCPIPIPGENLAILKAHFG